MHRSLLLFALALVCGTARAQAPVALNGLIPRAHAAALPDAALFLTTSPGERGAASGTEPDTTSPWRYFPLHPGDTWEYLDYGGAAVTRMVVSGDTTVAGQVYARIAYYYAEDGGTPTHFFTFAARFDTASATVLEPAVGGERPYLYAPCRLDAAWGSAVECGNGPADASGGYDGRLVFGGAAPGTGTDTVTAAYKRFYYDILTMDHRYVADFGLVYWLAAEAGIEFGLTFARVDGVAHGVERYPGVGVPVEPEPGGGAASDVGAVVVSPNPARGWAVASFMVAEAGPVTLALYDATGRRVLTRDLGMLAAGQHRTTLDLAGLAPGVYHARLTGPGGMVGQAVTVVR